MEENKRENFGTRLGFILVSAGCAIGLGNVWRFPYITGEYGGAAFIVLYIIFLLIFAMPIMAMEFAVGRGAGAATGRCFDILEKPGTKWHRFKWVCIAGNYCLMMFYTTVTGWFINYIFKCASGEFTGQDAEAISTIFSDLLANPIEMGAFMLIATAIGFAVCKLGLENGVEKITKWMMIALFAIMFLLCINSIMLPNSSAGLEFYLMPDFSKIFDHGFNHFLTVCFAAMGQAFFTLSIGMGSMLIFGSYIKKTHALPGEALRITALDTGVALMAGLIIFPACFSFGIEAGSGPGLVFITLPAVFAQMPFGNVWGALFFLFMSFAALSTVIAVFEGIIAFSMDHWGMSRSKSCIINCSLLAVLSIPCVLGFNVLSDVTIPGIGDIQSIEDFIISNNILPLGSLFILLFCTRKSGWGWDNFIKEVDAGEGIKFPKGKAMKFYVSYIIPICVFAVIVSGYIPIVTTWISGS